MYKPIQLRPAEKKGITHGHYFTLLPNKNCLTYALYCNACFSMSSLILFTSEILASKQNENTGKGYLL